MKTVRKYGGRCGRRGMPKKAAAEIARLYRKLKSCSKVAKVTGRTRQAVHKVLQRRGLTNPNDIHGARRKAGVIYKGERFTPDKDGYLRSTTFKSRQRGQHTLLHHVVWRERHGEWDRVHQIIIFKDGNRQNCAIDNLQLISRSEFKRQRWTGNGWTKYRERKAALFVVWQEALARGDTKLISKTRAVYDALPLPRGRDLVKFSATMKKVWDSYTPAQRQARKDASIHRRWADQRIAA